MEISDSLFGVEPRNSFSLGMALIPLQGPPTALGDAPPPVEQHPARTALLRRPATSPVDRCQSHWYRSTELEPRLSRIGCRMDAVGNLAEEAGAWRCKWRGVNVPALCAVGWPPRRPAPSGCSAHASASPALLRNCHPFLSAASLAPFPVTGWPGVGRSHTGVCPPGTAPVTEHSPSRNKEQGAADTGASAPGMTHPAFAQGQGRAAGCPSRARGCPCSLRQGLALLCPPLQLLLHGVEGKLENKQTKS